MKNPIHFFIIITSIIILLLVYSVRIIAVEGNPPKEVIRNKEIIQFDNNQLLIDIRQANWECCVLKNEDKSGPNNMYSSGKKVDLDIVKAEYENTVKVKKWKPVHVGRRWETMGYPDLNNKEVWLHLKFYVSSEMKGYKFGFFCTAVDDAAHFFLNGTFLDKKAYVWGARIPEPVNIDLTSQIQFGKENLLAIRLSDYTPARGGGILGNVLLYRTLPYVRTPMGGVVLTDKVSDKYSVVLNIGDALLSRDQKTAFTSEELSTMEIPPYILRDEELVLVIPSEAIKQRVPQYKVDLNFVCQTYDKRLLAIQCGELPTRVELFDLMTIPLNLSATYNNPFDPRQINVQAVVETPSGKTEKVAAFFYQDFTPIPIRYEEEILLPKAGNPWRLYYRPREKGTYTFHLIAQDRTGMKRTPDQKFDVTASDKKGFLRVSKDDPRFFEFDNGESYFGIGPSGWCRDTNYIFGGNTRWISTRLLDEYYKRKADAGSNYDYCLAEFFGRLYTQGGFIDQHVAWKCEHRIRTLEKLGIYWVTCYDDLCRSTVYGLNTLPYSEFQGGPCNRIEELYFKERSLEMQRDHLRYFVSRMSDSPALMVWAIGDEGQDGNSFSRLMVRSWIKELQNYVHTIDVYQHPHVIGEGPLSITHGGEAIIIPDWYFNPGLTADGVKLVQEIMKKYNRFNCPLINPEGGMVQWTKPDDSYGPKSPGYYLSGERWKFPEAISFHNNLWISLFMKNAVGGTEWLGHFIVQKNQLFHATAMRNFLEGESLTKPHWEIVTPVVSHPDLRGFCLQSEGNSWVWIQNKFYTWLEAGHYGKTPPVISDSKIDIPVKKNGNYNVELWDTRSGKVISTTTVLSKEGKIFYLLPPIEKDVALKVNIID
ncbi:MAG: DUF5060 domain-containing protein [Bacteroidales bacterium]|nr:DUF5060 domain-containing protein [Bacteroidales bacterium]